MHYKDAKRYMERALLKLLRLPADYTGVTEVKLSWKDGSITTGIIKEKDTPMDWHGLSNLK